jgi:myosin-3
LAITAIELCEGEPPLSNENPMKALFQIPRLPPPTLRDRKSFSPLLNDFIAKCLVKNFEQRPFAHNLLNHELFKHIKFEKAKFEFSFHIKKQRKTRNSSSITSVTPSKLIVKNEFKCVDDLTTLECISEAIITDQLKVRFETDQVYTYIGDILISCNPFKDLQIYTHFYQEKYSNSQRSNNPPHIYAIADLARNNLIVDQANQVLVISGESCSGKTESTNLLLKQLVHLSKSSNKNLEEKILQSNPIIEAFGNATTQLNSNSSRFGKYLELSMTKSGNITGARIYVYLLEQCRIVKQSINEGNFHIFYYFYDGLEEENKLADYYLDASFKNQHKFLKPQKRNVQVNRIIWKQLNNSFRVVGFKNDQIDSIYRILAGILNLGDIEFCEIDDELGVKDMASLLRSANLLGIESNDLLEALTCTSVVTRGEIIVKHNTIQEAIVIRDAMARTLYARLFDWIVNHINTSLNSNHENL